MAVGTSGTESEPNEETSLLPSATTARPTTKAQPTPLPKLQLSLLLLLQFSEPICSQCIYPFINELITEFNINGGDEKVTGYYAGVIFSLFYIAEATTVFQWNSLSDTMGRKPVLLIGQLGACLSMLCFGYARTFWGLVVSRCLCGMLNGNSGVMKSMMAEITDSTNRAQGFALIPIAWCMGATVGPFIGGFLARPHTRFPGTFTGEFWVKYPYFLPCAVSAAFVALTFVIGLFFLEETAPAKERSRSTPPISNKAAAYGQVELALPEPRPESQGRISLRSLMTYPVIISVLNYGALAFLDLAIGSVRPLFYATPIEYGGLGLSPAVIGQLLSSFGFINGIMQAVFCAKLVSWWGARRIFLFGMISALPVFSLFPVMSVLAQQWGLSSIVWVVLVIQLSFYLAFDMAFPPIFIYIMAAAPSKRCLGATNGLSQTTAAVARAVGPMISTSLFAVSKEHNLLGGNAVYLVFFLLSCICLWCANLLPESGWDTAEGERE